MLGKDYIDVFAIVRIEDTPAMQKVSFQDQVTVRQIVWTEQEARSEVQRLNKLNAKKGCTYFWQMTRLCGVSTHK